MLMYSAAAVVLPQFVSVHHKKTDKHFLNFNLGKSKQMLLTQDLKWSLAQCTFNVNSASILNLRMSIPSKVGLIKVIPSYRVSNA